MQAPTKLYVKKKKKKTWSMAFAARETSRVSSPPSTDRKKGTQGLSVPRKQVINKKELTELNIPCLVPEPVNFLLKAYLQSLGLIHNLTSNASSLLE